MTQIKKFTLVVILVISFVATVSVLLPTAKVSAQTPPGCDFPRPEVVEQCTQQYIADEIARRCSGQSASAAERCAQETRENIANKDFNHNGTPDSQELANNPAASSAPTNCDEDSDNDGSTIDPEDCRISAYLRTFTNVLIALVGIVITIMIVVGGIQYSAAQDNPQAVQAARGKIMNALLALLVYIFMSAFLQYIVPGGIF